MHHPTCSLLCCAFAEFVIVQMCCLGISAQSIFSASEFVDGLDGQYFYPREESAIGPAIKIYGSWEKPLKDIALTLIENIFMDLASENGDNCLDPTSCNNIIVYDVGANFGSWAVPLATAIKKRGKVFAFELQGHMLSYLHMNILANRMSGVIYPLQVALSNTTGYVEINNLYNDELTNYGAYSLDQLRARKNSHSNNQKPASTTTRVPMDTLDNLFYNSNILSECPHVIKADIEGHEMHLFVGAQRLLQECKPVIIFEAECKILMRSLITFLDHIGYSLAWVAAPVIDMHAEFNGYKPIEVGVGIYGGRFSDKEYAGWAVIGGNNIVAVPKKEKNWISQFPSTLIEIDVASKKFLVDDYDIVLCHGDHWCLKRQHEANVLNACHLSASVRPDELDYFIANDYMVNYWKHFQ